MTKIENFIRIAKPCLGAVLLYAAFTSSVIAQEAGDCSEQRAIEIVRTDTSVASYCNKNGNPHYECLFKAAHTSPVDVQSEPDVVWYVTASTPKLVILGRVSNSCQMVVRRPFYLNPIELGTLEQGVFESKDVVTGKVVDVKSPEPIFTHGGVKIQTETVTVEVNKVLKGKQASKLVFDQHFSTAETSAKRWLNNGHEMLFFISQGGLFNSSNNPGCLFLADKAGQEEDQKLAALQACQNCVDLSQKAGPEETQQREVLESCVSKIKLDHELGLESFLSSMFKKPTIYQKPVLLGNWPNGIDLETGKNDSTDPIFSKNGDILKTRDAILTAVQAEVTREVAHSQKDITVAQTPSGQLGKETELSPVKYPQAYEAGIPKNALVILDVPPQ